MACTFQEKIGGKFLSLICLRDDMHVDTAYNAAVADTASEIQSTLVISKSKGPSETVRDIRTSTYQICSTEENTG